MNSDFQELSQILSSTLSSDKAVRSHAEDVLKELEKKQPDFVIRLIHFSTQPVGVDTGSEGNVMLAAAIRVRNMLSLCDWNRSVAFSEDVRKAVREIIVPLQCQVHVEEHIRRQLLSATNALLEYDFPTRWDSVTSQVSELLQNCMFSLSAFPLTATTDSEQNEIVSLLLQVKGALGVLRYCCKVCSDASKVEECHLSDFATMMVPSILMLWEHLLSRWEHEIDASSASIFQVGASPAGSKLMELNACVTELSHCLRLCLKSLWSLTEHRWPKVLCDESAFSQFWTLVLLRPTKKMHSTLLPLFAPQIENEVQRTQWYGDRFTNFQEASVWRLAKWIGAMMHKLVQECSTPKECEKRQRGVAKLFQRHYLPYVMEYSFELIRWHTNPYALNSKSFIMALESVTLAIEEEGSYTRYIAPAAEELLTSLLFPRFSFSTDDGELWDLNPEEYVRKQSSPEGDLYNPKVVSASLMLSLVVPKKPFHDASLAEKFLTFIVNQLTNHSARAAETLPASPADPALESARRVDASLFCLFQLKKIIKKMICVQDGSLQNILLQYVVPATTYPIGFLRARAVQVLSLYAKVVPWSDPQSFHQALNAVLPLLSDVEIPVQVQTCVSFSLMLHHPYAYEIIDPCIGKVVQQYFNVMRMMDNEAVVRTLQKTIQCYSNSLCKWAVELTDMIVEHFLKVAEKASGKYDLLEASSTSAETVHENDDFVTLLMSADELLETLTILIKSIPMSSASAASPAEDHVAQVILMLQDRIGPLLENILRLPGETSFGFMDSVLRVLTTLLSRSPAVLPSLWRLIPFFYMIVCKQGAVDYFGQLLAPLDNYSSVEPLRFMLTPLEHLMGGPSDPFCDATLLQCTPAQLVLQLTENVLSNTSLRLREKSSVPKVYDAFLQNYWWAATQSEEQQRTSPVLETIVSSITKSSVLHLQTMGVRSPTMKMLLLNSVLSAILASPLEAAKSLFHAQVLETFFEVYCSHVLDPRVAALLRDYDRRLFVAAMAEIILAIQRLRQGPSPSNEDLRFLDHLDHCLQKCVECGLLHSFANKDILELTKETKAFLEHRSRTQGADEDSWESDGDSDDFSMDEEIDEEDWDMEDAADMNAEYDDGKLSQLIRRAQAASNQHQSRIQDDDISDDGETEAEDNLLDEEDMVSPVLQKMNAWMALRCVAAEVEGISAAFALRGSGEQWNSVLQAEEALRRWNEAQTAGEAP